MTGYAYVFKKSKDHSAEVIVRSFNFKYLEVSVRNLPQDRILLEERIKKEVKGRISRGKIEIYIFLKGPAEGDIYVNERVLAMYIRQLKNLSKKYNLKTDLQLNKLFTLPHVIGWEEKGSREENIIVPAVREAVNKLLVFKQKEGAIIKKEMLANLKRLKQNAQNIQKNKPHILSNDAEKTDIDEEISLMTFYINKLEKEVNAVGSAPQGKSMDFLMQEILRELNTASSKTNNATLGSLIVESKNYLERIREQAQNIE
jgi:uncharacterized protein YicC (UPF0701 family)